MIGCHFRTPALPLAFRSFLVAGNTHRSFGFCSLRARLSQFVLFERGSCCHRLSRKKHGCGHKGRCLPVAKRGRHGRSDSCSARWTQRQRSRREPQVRNPTEAGAASLASPLSRYRAKSRGLAGRGLTRVRVSQRHSCLRRLLRVEPTWFVELESVEQRKGLVEEALEREVCDEVTPVLLDVVQSVVDSCAEGSRDLES